ncbi:NRT2.5, partial [Symbiodinium pilosum]
LAPPRIAVCRCGLISTDGRGRSSHNGAARASTGLLEAAKLLACRVDVSIDVSDLGEEDLVRFLHTPKSVLEKLRTLDPPVGEEVKNLAIVAWKPGTEANMPLRVSFSMGADSPEEVVVRGRRFAMRCKTQMNEENIRHVETETMVAFNEDFRDIAMQRCKLLQQLTQRVAATPMANRGGG